MRTAERSAGSRHPRRREVDQVGHRWFWPRPPTPGDTISRRTPINTRSRTRPDLGFSTGSLTDDEPAHRPMNRQRQVTKRLAFVRSVPDRPKHRTRGTARQVDRQGDRHQQRNAPGRRSPQRDRCRASERTLDRIPGALAGQTRTHQVQQYRPRRAQARARPKGLPSRIARRTGGRSMSVHHRLIPHPHDPRILWMPSPEASDTTPRPSGVGPGLFGRRGVGVEHPPSNPRRLCCRSWTPS